MPDSVDLGYAIKLPPRRAIAYFKQKGYTISWNWWETSAAAHARAFTVAKGMRQDILSNIYNELDKSLAKGITERAFIKTLEPKLKSLGWWGKQVHVGSDGVAELVQLGSPHRLKTIYRTNLHTARAVARNQVQKEDADNRPFWQYDALEDGRTRPEHAAINGQVFRHDDPFWDTHYPPNGFNCRCRVRALTQEDLTKKGLKVVSSEGKFKQVKQDVGIDKRTGEVIQHDGTAYTYRGKDGKQHTLLPDPGWSHNPGQMAPPFSPTGSLNTVLPPAPGQKTWRDFGLREQLPTIPVGAARLPRQTDPVEQLNQFYAATTSATFERLLITRADGKKDQIYNIIRTPEGLDDVYLTDSFMRHVILDKQAEHREQFANFVIPTLQNPTEVWRQVSIKADGTKVIRDMYLGAFDALNTVLVVQQDVKHGGLSWTFYPKDKFSDGVRSGERIHKETRGRE